MCIRDRFDDTLLANIRIARPQATRKTGNKLKALRRAGGLFYLLPRRLWAVSYTHLDVYKRQRYR